jgi:hypothetical protein
MEFPEKLLISTLELNKPLRCPIGLRHLPRSGTALSSWVLLAMGLGFRSYGVTVRQLV